ncbi:MAG: prolyl oligopeptidase family serine peptidase [Planctomycetaceae bacterium]|jgi:predicted esterase|nr:prolyl oligopeptidase family serine peptidase [Planctomycetaceae bacterium]
MKKLLFLSACALFIATALIYTRLIAEAAKEADKPATPAAAEDAAKPVEEPKPDKEEAIVAVDPKTLTQEQLEAISIQSVGAFQKTNRIAPAMLPLFKEESITYNSPSKYKDAVLKYRLHTPEKMEPGKKYPLILWLHGAGEAGEDNSAQLVHLHHIITYLTGKKERDFFLLVPQAPGNHCGWSGGSSRSSTAIVLPKNVAAHNTQLSSIGPNNTMTTTTFMLDSNRKDFSKTVTVTATQQMHKSIRNRGIIVNSQIIEKISESTTKYPVSEFGKVYRELQMANFRESAKRSFGEGTSLIESIIKSETPDGADRFQIIAFQPLENSPLGYSLAMTDEVIKKYPVDTDRITVSGLSTGGEGTWAALEARPNFFAAGVPLVSWRSFSDEELQKSPELKKIPIWAIYSSDDRGIDAARDNFERAEAAGCNVKKSEFGICGHNAWTPAMLQGDIFSWMLSRGKKDGEYVQVEDSSVNPDDLKGIVDVATRDPGAPKLAPPNPNPKPNQPAITEAEDAGETAEKEEKTVEIEMSEGNKVTGKVIEDCDRPWAMTSDSQYGLFAADWIKESKALPDFVSVLPTDELAKRLAGSVSGDGKDFAEVCRSVINGENKPASNPFFSTEGGRLRSDIKYSLSDKGKMFLRLLNTVKDSKTDLADLAKKSVEKVSLITER